MDAVRGAANLVLSVGGAALFVAAVVAFAVSARRAWTQSRRTEVVVETLNDATGDPMAAAAVVGLTYRLREGVVAALPVLADRAREIVEKAKSDPTSPIRAVLSEDIDRREALLGDITSSQDELMEAMEGMVPQPARGAYRAVAAALLRPKEVRILGVLQRVNDAGGGVGVSFNVNHVGAAEAASRISLWEDDAAAAATVVERCHVLVPPAARALACELLRQRLKVTLAQRLSGGRRAGGAEDAVDRDAVVEFLVGRSYKSAAHGSAPATKSFYELAAASLRRSAAHFDHYGLSSQLARTLSELGRRQGDNHIKAVELLLESTRLFEEAARKLPAAGLEPVQNAAEELGIRAALTTNACLLAELLPDDEVRSKAAAHLACALGTVDPAGCSLDSVLYNVACALGVAARVASLARYGAGGDECLERSKRWLAYAVITNERWWTSAGVDPDLRLLAEWLPEAHRRLLETIADRGAGAPPDPDDVAARAESLLAARPAVGV